MTMVDGGSKNLLPEDLIIDILSRIPCKSLIRFRCVSKPWCSLICDPYFICAHSDRAKKGPPTPIFCIEQDDESGDLSISVVNEREKIVMKNAPRISRLRSCKLISSNGLISIYSHDNDISHDTDVIYVFNPATRQSLTLPQDTLCMEGRMYFKFYFFGFHPRTKEYKVVRFFELRGGIGNFECEVFTLGSKSWRQLEDLKYPLMIPNDSACVNGSIFCLLNYKLKMTNDLISSFDLEHEKFSVIPQPQGMENLEDVILVELEGTLWLSHYLSTRRLHLWCLRDHTNYVWVKQHIIIFDGYPYRGYSFISDWPLTIFNNKILLYTCKGFVYYDPQSRSITELYGQEKPIDRGHACAYVESLVPIGGVDNPHNMIL